MKGLCNQGTELKAMMMRMLQNYPRLESVLQDALSVVLHPIQKTKIEEITQKTIYCSICQVSLFTERIGNRKTICFER